jgi:hypothetical protein
MTAREMQRRSAKARWSGKTAEARRREMSALAKGRWAKTVRKPETPRTYDARTPKIRSGQLR